MSERGANVGKPRRKDNRVRTAVVHRWVRYATQIIFFVMAPATFSGAFSGAKYLFEQIGLGQAIEASAFVVQLAALLGFTVLFGRFFCGYACAFGALGDVAYGVCEGLRAKLGLRRPALPDRVVSALSWVKYLLLAGIFAACFFGAWGSVSGYSPWVAFASVLAGTAGETSAIALVLLALVVALMIVRERAFCQFLCPLGALFSLMPVLPFSEYVRMRPHCAKRCGRCHAACPVGIWPDADVVEHGECIACGRCADVCPMNNVNMVAVPKEKPAKGVVVSRDEQTKRPVHKTRDTWRLLRGSEVGYTVARALLLLLLCWMTGAVRYFPPFAEVVGFNPLSF